VEVIWNPLAKKQKYVSFIVLIIMDQLLEPIST